MSRGGLAALVGAVVASLALVGVVPAAAQSGGEKPKATEVGVTASEIHVATIADVDNPFAPGVFQGAKYGAEGAAQYLNSKAGGGGIDGRKIVVDFIDSHLNANEARNGVITACQDDFAAVGSAVLFLTSADDLTNCADQAGHATGLPDMPSFSAGVVESCAPTVYGLNPPQVHCDTATSTPQKYTSSKGGGPWFVQQHGKKKLHGLMVYPSDTKDASRAARALLDAFVASGIKADQSVGVSAAAPQSAYTAFVNTMKADNSNVVDIIGGNPILLRSEMQLQGVDLSSVVFQCGCYSASDEFTSNPVMNGVYIWGYTLPFEEASTNAMLRNFLEYVPKDKRDGFAEFAWAAMLAFAQAAKTTIDKHGVNGLTRANFLKDGVTTLTKFDADGMMGATNMVDKIPTDCTMLLQLKDKKYVRIWPKKKGTFDCKPSNLATIEADLVGG
jgi:Periplasmic binding protein